MIDQKLHDRIDEFLTGNYRNQWIKGDYLEVYLRKSMRMIEGGLIHLIDIANLSMAARHQMQGVFPAFLDHLENKRIAIYIENVFPIQLRWYYERRSYVPCGDNNWMAGMCQCYYRRLL